MDTAYTSASSQDAPPQNFPEDAFSREISAPDDNTSTSDTLDINITNNPDIHDDIRADICVMDTNDDYDTDSNPNADSSDPDDESDDGFGGPDIPADSSHSPDIRQDTPAPPFPVSGPQNLYQQFARSASHTANLNLQHAVASGAPASVTNALRRTADTAEFIAAFPEAAKNPLAIPREVWDGVRNGLSLTASYSRFAVSQAQSRAQNAQRLAALQANAAVLHQQNISRSTGSMHSAGSHYSVNDPFLQGWGE